ncbi:MAG: cytochrome c [Proteobacteria bacterium]|nr:cytochrome c [Pseudomonadota bacterium]
MNYNKYSNNSNLSVKIFFILMLSFPIASSFADDSKKGDFQTGAKTWADNCARCHNMRDPKDLRDDQWVTTAFHMRVRAGLTGQQTRDVIAFLQESNNTAVKTPVVSTKQQQNIKSSGLSGEEVYQQTCVACHGSAGVGTVPGAPDFSKTDNSLSQADEVLIKRITEGFQSEGSPMAMPAKGGNASLNQADIRAVIAYMREKFAK